MRTFTHMSACPLPSSLRTHLKMSCTKVSVLLHTQHSLCSSKSAPLSGLASRKLLFGPGLHVTTSVPQCSATTFASNEHHLQHVLP